MRGAEQHTAFNSPLEAGVRSVALLLAAYPGVMDLQRLVVYDYLAVHSGDMGGPPSLHPLLPFRSAELLVRRGLIERGLLLMMSRGLVERVVDATGVGYRADELAEIFMSTTTAPYLRSLARRASWVVETCGSLDDAALRRTVGRFFSDWVAEFHAAQGRLEVDL